MYGVVWLSQVDGYGRDSVAISEYYKQYEVQDVVLQARNINY